MLTPMAGWNIFGWDENVDNLHARRFKGVRNEIVEEGRAVRRTIEKECGNDPGKCYEWRRLQEAYKPRLVRRAPRPALLLLREVAG